MVVGVSNCVAAVRWLIFSDHLYNMYIVYGKETRICIYCLYDWSVLSHRTKSRLTVCALYLLWFFKTPILHIQTMDWITSAGFMMCTLHAHSLLTGHCPDNSVSRPQTPWVQPVSTVSRTTLTTSERSLRNGSGRSLPTPVFLSALYPHTHPSTPTGLTGW